MLRVCLEDTLSNLYLIGRITLLLRSVHTGIFRYTHIIPALFQDPSPDPCLPEPVYQ